MTAIPTLPIHNDFIIEWSIVQCDIPVALHDYSLKLIVTNPRNRVEIVDFYTVDNKVVFTLWANLQVVTGVYGLTLLASRNGSHHTWRADKAFRLEYVADYVSILPVVSNLSVPRNGLSAYELAVLDGYTGSYDEWVTTYSSIVSLPITINYADGTLEVYNLAHIVPRSDEYGSYAYDPVGTWDAGDTTEGEEVTNNTDTTVVTNEDDTTP